MLWFSASHTKGCGWVEPQTESTSNAGYGMKFLCGSCRTKYQISDDKVRGKILTIRCKKCGAKILVRESLAASGGTAVAPIADDESTVAMSKGPTTRRSMNGRPEQRASQSTTGAPPSASRSSTRSGGSAALASAFDLAMGQGASDSDDMPTSIAPVPANLDIAGVEWYVAVDGSQQGPFAFAEVVKKVEACQLIGRHYVWHDGMANWTRLRDIPDLAKYLPTPRKVPPPPPPPPTSDEQRPKAEVVELAAHRAQQLGHDLLDEAATPVGPTKTVPTADEGRGDPQREAPEEEDRAEELDQALNHVLGIPGEVRTAQPDTPSRPSVPATQEVEEEILASDDIFANIPRATTADEVNRESTRFFVAAAGVNKQRKRNRIGLISAGVVGAVLVAFVGLWASGVLSIRLPGIGDPFANMRQGRSITEDGQAEKLSAKELALLKGNKKKKANKRRRRGSSKSRGDRAAAAGLGGDYFDESDDSMGGAGPRGVRDGERIDIGSLGTGGVKGRGRMPEADLPSTNPDVPVPDQSSLSQDAVARVVKQNSMSVRFCYQQSLKGSTNLRGKLQIKLRVEPTGKVSRTEVQTSQFKGTTLANCISDKIRKWVFPRFDGEAKEFLVPFVLEKSF